MSNWYIFDPRKDMKTKFFHYKELNDGVKTKRQEQSIYSVDSGNLRN